MGGSHSSYATVVTSLMVIGLVEMCFYFVTWHHVTTWSKGRVTWQVGAPEPKSPLCQIWYLQVLWNGKYNLFILTLDLTWPHNQRDLWLRKWEPFNLSYQYAKFGDYKSCGSGDITILLCQVTSREHRTKEPSHLVNKKLLILSQHPTRLGGCRSCESSDITLWICLVIQQWYFCLVS